MSEVLGTYARLRLCWGDIITGAWVGNRRKFWMDRSFSMSSERAMDLSSDGKQPWFTSIQASTSVTLTAFASGKARSQARAMASHSWAWSIGPVGFWSYPLASSAGVCSDSFDMSCVQRTGRQTDFADAEWSLRYRACVCSPRTGLELFPSHLHGRRNAHWSMMERLDPEVRIWRRVELELGPSLKLGMIAWADLGPTGKRTNPNPGHLLDHSVSCYPTWEWDLLGS